MATIEEALAVAHDHWKSGRLDEAKTICHNLLNLGADPVENIALLGLIYHAQGRYGLAEIFADKAVLMSPTDVRHHMALGKARLDMTIGVDPAMGDKAAAAFLKGTELAPDNAENYDWLGQAYAAAGQLDAAVLAYQKALKLNSNLMAANGNLACALMQLGCLDEAMKFHNRAIELMPDHIVANDNLLLCAQYRPGVTLQELLTLHQEWQERVITPLNLVPPEWPQPKDPDKRLKIGFVSHDFARHPVGYFLLGLLVNLDPTQIETVCYSDRVSTDDMTEKLRNASGSWMETASLTHRDLAEKIYADGVDILFDLAGHTAKSRLLCFAFKPAPIQITWAGYVCTTGLQTMDYILADPYHVPKAHDAYFTETVLRLPNAFVCVTPPTGAPEIAPLPAGENDPVTFVSFSIPTKIHRQTFDIWSQILIRVPGSKLILMYRGMDDAANVQRISDGFAARGIKPDRIDIRGQTPHLQLLACYATEADIALDTFPYSGGLTTCEALWMGVPVITCPGETFASRHTHSFLSVMGLENLSANSLEDYVKRAVALAKDRQQLVQIRAGLRNRMRASPLHDTKLFAKNFTQLMRQAWFQWCNVPDTSQSL